MKSLESPLCILLSTRGFFYYLRNQWYGAHIGVITETNNSPGRIIRLNYSSGSINTVGELIRTEIIYHTKYGNETKFLDDIVLIIRIRIRIFNSVDEHFFISSTRIIFQNNSSQYKYGYWFP